MTPEPQCPPSADRRIEPRRRIPLNDGFVLRRPPKLSVLFFDLKAWQKQTDKQTLPSELSDLSWWISDSEVVFLKAIFGIKGIQLDDVHLPITLDRLPRSFEALGNYLIEHCVPLDLRRLFTPEAWNSLKDLLSRKRSEWTCPLCEIPRYLKMSACAECKIFYHDVCRSFMDSRTDEKRDPWICLSCSWKRNAKHPYSAAD